MAYRKPRSNANAASIKSPTSPRKRDQSPRRTYVYKMTIDDGVAPCAPPAAGNTPAYLSLAICKPAIRRKAKPGDRIFGITGKTIAKSQGHPLNAIIYSAAVASVISSQSYATNAYSDRLDSIYTLDNTTGHLTRHTTTNIHPSLKEQTTDLGFYPSYKNAHVLPCDDFRYFGSHAVPIPASAPTLLQISCVFSEGDGTARELEHLRSELWEKETRYTPDHLLAGGSWRSGSGKQTAATERHTSASLSTEGSRRCGSGKHTDAKVKKRQASKKPERLGWKRVGGC